MSKIFLKLTHVNIDAEIVKSVFDNIHYAYVTYLANRNQILITPVNSVWFTKLYKPTQFLLKSRNLKGDKTLAIREIFIDNELDTHDRDLSYVVEEGLNLIKITL